MLFLIGMGIGFCFGSFVFGIVNYIVHIIRYDGILLVDDNDEHKTNWTLQVKTDPENIPKKKSIRLQVHVQK